jgi:hypothetical protein
VGGLILVPRFELPLVVHHVPVLSSLLMFDDYHPIAPLHLKTNPKPIKDVKRLRGGLRRFRAKVIKMSIDGSLKTIRWSFLWRRVESFETATAAKKVWRLKSQKKKDEEKRIETCVRADVMTNEFQSWKRFITLRL